MADGQLLWRVFSNLLTNIVKYAMQGTRVYLTTAVQDGYAQITFRNISSAPLSMSGEELSAVLDQCDFRKYTRNTITDRREFISHLKQVRRQGWAIDDEEFEEGHRCIGSTVYDYRGLPIAAISASGSVSVLTDDRLSDTIEKVKLWASQLSRQIGYLE